jgi:sulfatase maturation enzyme AslB (radical SAM superfamily)
MLRLNSPALSNLWVRSRADLHRRLEIHNRKDRGVAAVTGGRWIVDAHKLGANMKGQFLTFVVPAPGGCNLKCSFCFVRQRREITETLLTPQDSTRFVRAATDRAPIFALPIQGYEPLLPESSLIHRRFWRPAGSWACPPAWLPMARNLSMPSTCR